MEKPYVTVRIPWSLIKAVAKKAPRDLRGPRMTEKQVDWALQEVVKRARLRRASA